MGADGAPGMIDLEAVYSKPGCLKSSSRVTSWRIPIEKAGPFGGLRCTPVSGPEVIEGTGHLGQCKALRVYTMQGNAVRHMFRAAMYCNRAAMYCDAVRHAFRATCTRLAGGLAWAA